MTTLICPFGPFSETKQPWLFSKAYSPPPHSELQVFNQSYKIGYEFLLVMWTLKINRKTLTSSVMTLSLLGLCIYLPAYPALWLIGSTAEQPLRDTCEEDFQYLSTKLKELINAVDISLTNTYTFFGLRSNFLLRARYNQWHPIEKQKQFSLSQQVSVVNSFLVWGRTLFLHPLVYAGLSSSFNWYVSCVCCQSL